MDKVTVTSAVERQIAGVALELMEIGSGPPMLLLHEGTGLIRDAAFLTRLAEAHRVLGPSHPGFGRSPRPHGFDSVDDLAHFYLRFLDALDLRGVIVVGFSFGGWVAAEIATRCEHRLSSLILVDAVGIRPGSPTDRPILDVFGVTPWELEQKTYAHPQAHAPKLSDLEDEDYLAMARNREALALYAWDPYMHNPKLFSRLSQLSLPTLVIWGELDGIVAMDYGRTYADTIPGAEFVTIPDAGHLPHLEQPDVFADTLLEFARRTAGVT